MLGVFSSEQSIQTRYCRAEYADRSKRDAPPQNMVMILSYSKQTYRLIAREKMRKGGGCVRTTESPVAGILVPRPVTNLLSGHKKKNPLTVRPEGLWCIDTEEVLPSDALLGVREVGRQVGWLRRI